MPSNVYVDTQDIACVSASDNVSAGRPNLPTVHHISDPDTRLSLTFPNSSLLAVLRYAPSSGEPRTTDVQFDSERSLSHRTNHTILQNALKQVHKARRNRNATNLERSALQKSQFIGDYLLSEVNK